MIWARSIASPVLWVAVLFFALMLAYVRGCERLGRETTDTTEKTP